MRTFQMIADTCLTKSIRNWIVWITQVNVRFTSLFEQVILFPLLWTRIKKTNYSRKKRTLTRNDADRGWGIMSTLFKLGGDNVDMHPWVEAWETLAYQQVRLRISPLAKAVKNRSTAENFLLCIVTISLASWPIWYVTKKLSMVEVGWGYAFTRWHVSTAVCKMET